MYHIYVVNPARSSKVNLSNNAAYNYYPAVSPDGTKIAFMSVRDVNGEVYIMNADGSEQTNLFNNAAMDHLPAWGHSPASFSNTVAQTPRSNSASRGGQHILLPH